MRLSVIMLRKKMPPGNIWLGKNRLPYRVHQCHIDRMQGRIGTEERNLLLLRNPYLTKSQTEGVNYALGKGKKIVDNQRYQRALKFVGYTKNLDHVHVESRLAHLFNCETWD